MSTQITLSEQLANIKEVGEIWQKRNEQLKTNLKQEKDKLQQKMLSHEAENKLLQVI